MSLIGEDRMAPSDESGCSVNLIVPLLWSAWARILFTTSFLISRVSATLAEGFQKHGLAEKIHIRQAQVVAFEVGA